MQRLLYTSLLILFIASCGRAQNVSDVKTRSVNFSAIYQPSDAEVKQVTSGGWEAFLNDHQQQSAAGFRLTDLESYKVGGGKRQYLGLYTESSLPDSVGRAKTWKGFIKLKRKMAKAGYTMVDITGVVLNESDTDYYGVWVKKSQPTTHKVWLMNSKEAVLKRTRAMAHERFKVKRIHVLDIPNGEPAYVVLYHHSPINRYNFLFFADNLEAFNLALKERQESEVQLIDFDRFREGPQERYVAIFQDGAYDNAFQTGKTLEEVTSFAEEVSREKGLKLINLSVD